MAKYVCSVCGFVYDEAVGIPEAGIAPGTKWEDISEGFECPICRAGKNEFEPKEAKETAPIQTVPAVEADDELRELSNAELSILCSNMKRSCEKQYKAAEAESFGILADWFWARAKKSELAEFGAIAEISDDDDKIGFPAAKAAAGESSDRGAMRALVWGEKSNKMMGSLLRRWEKEGSAFFAETKVYVCDICGYIYIGDTPPDICPVCKVPSLKILPIARRQ